MSRAFSSHRNTTFLTMPTKIWTFPRWEKTSVGVGQPLKATGKGEETVDQWLIVLAETTKVEERIC